jgi:hypothetical protein
MVGGFALAGCGGSGSSSSHTTSTSQKTAAASPVCLPKAEVALSRVVGAHVSEISQSPAGGTCTFRVRLTDGRRVSVVASVDSRPQPDVRLERAAVETTQQFASRIVFAVLQTIQGLGRDANWYPVKHQLQTTDGRVLVTVRVRSDGLSPDAQRHLAVAMTAAYLR